jgi:glycine/D-amino acid oxidase-like deaminating enzyme
VDHLLGLCARAGVRIRLAACSSLLSRGSRVTGSRTSDGEDVAAALVVTCVGAWTPTLLPDLAQVLRATAQPVLHFRPTDPDDFRGDRFPPFAADIAGSGWYGFPALPDGRVKIAHHGRGVPADPGSTGTVQPAHVRRTRSFLAEAIPDLANAPVVGKRICLYCDSFDGDLFIGHDPTREGLVVAAGGSGHAFKFAPMLGPIIADVVERRANPWADRFRWRGPGRPKTEEARSDVP